MPALSFGVGGRSDPWSLARGCYAPEAMDMDADRPSDDLRTTLEREMYWAEEGTALGRMTTAEVRDALHDFAVLMRADEKQVIPRGEPHLASRSRWRRQLKLRLFRLTRPISWRYDRVTADLAELTASLADRLAASEAEGARLRELLDERGEGPGESA